MFSIWRDSHKKEENRDGDKNDYWYISAACQEFKKAIGAEKVRDDEVILLTNGGINHGFDPMMPFQKNSMVDFLKTTEDLVETLKIAKASMMIISLGHEKMRRYQQMDRI